MYSEIIRKLQSNDSRIFKENTLKEILTAAILGDQSSIQFLELLKSAYDPFAVYHVKVVPQTENYTGKENPWNEFVDLLYQLTNRKITGHMARDAIIEMSEKFDSDEWNDVCRGVILKDLRCGISEKTINKVVKGTQWEIPVFSCQLAKDSADYPEKLTGTVLLEPKLDGVRVLAFVNVHVDGVVLYSRNGKEFTNFEEIAASLRKFASSVGTKLLPPYAMVFDGEVVGESFQSLMKQARRKKDVETTNMVYHVFDCLPAEDFVRGYYNGRQYYRKLTLEKLLGDFTKSVDNIKLVPGIDVDLDTPDGNTRLSEFIDDSLAKGFEGAMIKNIDAPYECKRNNHWLKYKPNITVDLTVVGVDEGLGRNENRLGALVCEGMDNGRRIRVNVGSGFSDSDRTEYWDARDTIIGQLVEVQADVVTQNQDGSYSLRFPRFVRFRSFDDGEKI